MNLIGKINRVGSTKAELMVAVRILALGANVMKTADFSVKWIRGSDKNETIKAKVYPDTKTASFN